jgi:putative ABC transport system permease protein
MTIWTLIRRSLRFHARAHLGVVLGAAIGSAALIGALVVGDSVRGSLRQRALNRVGGAQYLLEGQDRLFTDSTNTWSRAFGDAYALGLRLPAIASAGQGAARANQVNLCSVRPDFWKFSPARAPVFIEPDSVLLSEALATQLRVGTGDSILLRFRKPTAFSTEAPLSPQSGNSLALRLRVQGILTAAQFGDFSPVAAATAPRNAFVGLEQLQEAAGLAHRANLVLEAGTTDLPKSVSAAWRKLCAWITKLGLRPPPWLAPTGVREASPETGAAALDYFLSESWSAADAELDFKVREQPPAVELRSPRVFLDPPVVRQVTRPDSTPLWGAGSARLPSGKEQFILTYLANRLLAGTNTAPYCMVTAAGPPYTPVHMADDELLVNQWLAEDLGVHTGDWVEMTYFLPDSGPNLIEATNRFRVRAVVPLSGIYADPTLMPDFPGIEQAESTRDWDAGFQIDLKRIRPKDEAYWKSHRGTPKAFITLAAGQKLWANRFGDVTAIRFPVPEGVSVEEFRRALERYILGTVRPSDLGLRFEAVRSQALKAAAQGQDFGQLFLGFSLFVVAAALLLMALLFQLGLEQRASEVGILLALGLTPKQVQRLLLTE